MFNLRVYFEIIPEGLRMIPSQELMFLIPALQEYEPQNPWCLQCNWILTNDLTQSLQGNDSSLAPHFKLQT